MSTTYRGASAEVVESQVTKPLEDSLAGIEGVELMTSQSRSETSRINVRFTLKRDPDSAAADVRDKVSRARGKLPDTIDEPIIAKVEADSQPVIYIAVEAGSLTPLDASAGAGAPAMEAPVAGGFPPGGPSRSTWPGKMRFTFSMLFHAASSR